MQALPPGFPVDGAEPARGGAGSTTSCRLWAGDALAGLTKLRYLDLSHNDLEALPDGLFANLGSLRSVRLRRNPGAPFALHVELRRLDAAPPAAGPATIHAELAVGAPFAVDVDLSARGGQLLSAVDALLAPGAASLAAGATASSAILVRASGEGGALVTATVGEPPQTICDGVPCWDGFELIGDVLSLFAPAPVALTTIERRELVVDGDATLREDLAGWFDAPLGMAVTYTAVSSDPRVVRVRVEGGTLVADAVGDGHATVIVTATNEQGLSDTMRLRIRATFSGRSRWGGWRAILLGQ